MRTSKFAGREGDSGPARRTASPRDTTVRHAVIYSLMHTRRDKGRERQRKADVIQPGGRWSWTEPDRDLQHPESDI